MTQVGAYAKCNSRNLGTCPAAVGRGQNLRLDVLHLPQSSGMKKYEVFIGARAKVTYLTIFHLSYSLLSFLSGLYILCPGQSII